MIRFEIASRRPPQAGFLRVTTMAFSRKDDNAYRRNDYPAALGLAMKINMPGFTLGSVALAAVYGQLGEKESGRCTVNELLALKPEYASIARAELGKLAGPDLVEHLIDGLRKAGLEIAPETGAEVAANLPPRSENSTSATKSG